MTNTGKICCGCKHFKFYAADPGYSSYTPGSDASMVCLKNHWDIDFYEETQDTFVEKLATANDCPDYIQIERTRRVTDANSKGTDDRESSG